MLPTRAAQNSIEHRKSAFNLSRIDKEDEKGKMTVGSGITNSSVLFRRLSDCRCVGTVVCGILNVGIYISSTEFAFWHLPAFMFCINNLKLRSHI